MMKEKRKSSAQTIDPKLIAEGTAQLTSEIDILETWLNDLEKSGATDPASVEARHSYLDMLRSRREMLSALQEQARK